MGTAVLLEKMTAARAGCGTDLGSLRQQHHRAGDLAGVAVDEPPLGAANFSSTHPASAVVFVGKARDLGSSGVQKVAICLPAINSGKTFKSLQIMKC